MHKPQSEWFASSSGHLLPFRRRVRRYQPDAEMMRRPSCTMSCQRLLTFPRSYSEMMIRRVPLYNAQSDCRYLKVRFPSWRTTPEPFSASSPDIKQAMADAASWSSRSQCHKVPRYNALHPEPKAYSTPARSPLGSYVSETCLLCCQAILSQALPSFCISSRCQALTSHSLPSSTLHSSAKLCISSHCQDGYSQFAVRSWLLCKCLWDRVVQTRVSWLCWMFVRKSNMSRLPSFGDRWLEGFYDLMLVFCRELFCDCW